MNRTVRIVLTAAAIAVAVGLGWWAFHRHGPRSEIVLYGNIDLRQVELPFNDTDRVAEVLVQEGDHVRRGQVLARLDTGRLTPQLAQAEATAAAQQQALARLRNGSRPEEIAQARANLASAAAEATVAAARHQRLVVLSGSSSGRALSRQDLDDAKAAADADAARAAAARAALALSIAGPRREDIAQAGAQLQAQQAQVAVLRRQLTDADLVAPLDAVVRSRIVEPGEMATPQKPAFELAITDPKWVRAYVSETDLGHVKPGMKATVSVDAFKGRPFDGWVGFISHVAEFTPKSVQTEELRSSLVYEIRVFVKDPGDVLRLGMPATVRLPLAAEGARR